jgi:hypothetical protein
LLPIGLPGPVGCAHSCRVARPLSTGVAGNGVRRDHSAAGSGSGRVTAASPQELPTEPPDTDNTGRQIRLAWCARVFYRPACAPHQLAKGWTRWTRWLKRAACCAAARACWTFWEFLRASAAYRSILAVVLLQRPYALHAAILARKPPMQRRAEVNVRHSGKGSAGAHDGDGSREPCCSGKCAQINSRAHPNAARRAGGSGAGRGWHLRLPAPLPA